MDLEIKAKTEEVNRALRAVGFESSIKNHRLEAKLRKGMRRIHILGADIGNEKVYLDVHWDAPIHLAFLGVDYNNKPREICEKILNRLKTQNINGRITGGTNWFNRKNKAVFRRLRI
jgi:hypothetical protein